jgi:ERCC4-type nuclease
MSLLVDGRETALIEDLRRHGVEPTTAGLDIGDIHILDVDGSTPLLIIERKTAADFASSIGGGRYDEQKLRMKTHGGTAHLVYLIEDTFRGGVIKGRITEDTVLAAMFHTQFRDGFDVIRTTCTYESARFLIKLSECVKKHPDYFRKNVEVGPKDYADITAPASIKKMDSITPDVFIKHFYSSLPGISTSVADVFIEKWPTVNQFITFLTTAESPVLAIQTVTWLDRAGRKHKISPVNAGKICALLGFNS